MHSDMSADAAPISAADAALVERYLAHARVEKRLAERTLALYSLDLEKLAQFAAQSGVALTAVGNHHVRRWVAQMHAGGRSGRGIALILSGWRGFYAWLGREGLISASEAAASGSSSHCTESKPALTPQYGAVSDEARLFTSSLAPLANGSPA